MTIILFITGLTLLIVGAELLVRGASGIALNLRISPLVVGLTVVAFGTSAPELAVGIESSLTGNEGITFGTVVGSNIFNILGVLGISAMFASGGLDISPSMIRFDIPVMIAVALACLPIFFTGGVITRGEGVLFLGYYFAFTLYLILAATRHDALPVFSNVMMWFVIPLTVVMLVNVVYQQVIKGKFNLQ